MLPRNPRLKVLLVDDSPDRTAILRAAHATAATAEIIKRIDAPRPCTVGIICAP